MKIKCNTVDIVFIEATLCAHTLTVLSEIDFHLSIVSLSSRKYSRTSLYKID